MAKRFVVLGLGTFGSALAMRLARNGARVTGVDQNEANVEAVKDQLHEVLQADVTDHRALERLILTNAEIVFISLGENIERSILAALHCKDLGARRIHAKGVSDAHGRILKKLGVERVIFPERELAEQAADQAVWTNVLERLPIDQDYSLVEVAAPASLVGKTIKESDIRRRMGVTIVGVKDPLRNTMTLNPLPDFRIEEELILLIIGENENMKKFQSLT